MKTIGQHLYRPLSTLIMVLLALVLAMPQGRVSAQAGAPTSDDFNICAVNTGVWDFENPGDISGAEPTFPNAYTGDSSVEVTIPAGDPITFSNTNQNAPRLMQEISDASFEVETRFVAPMNAEGNFYKIAGVLVRDSSQSVARWLRFDFNSRNNNLNAYSGYLNGSGLDHLEGPVDLSGSNPASGPLTLRVKYDKAGALWTVTWIAGEAGTPHVFTVNESTLGVDFVPTHIGVFVGSTGGSGATPGSPPGNTMRVDYFRNLASPLTDDGIVLTVNTAGSGSGNVNRQCAGGNQVSLTAQPSSGSSFVNWTGDVSPSPNPNSSITVEMTQSRTVTANFSGSALELDFHQYAPIISQ